ncbi:SpvB/TcaC N-terminal domain-containing protein [Kribbella sp. NPDC006257]|uniref:SpvB/TcaC N-terminal domain-containing protein n=1 Tax=Kribbella sp. NPDC006257 TaxID=3156738 RepID=UPI0033B47D37
MNTSGRQGSPAKTDEPGTTSAERDRPSLSLPKAGGAIRGLGEKFSTDSVTGTASLSLPIPLTPGRGDLTPQLALSYDSGAGNGPFGLGWSCGPASISRRTDKGVPRYLDDEDVFQLTGFEDLVPTPTVRNEGDFVVRRYRPRTEGAFARIECWRHVSGDLHWQVTTRDNVTSIYGRDPAARITDPADPRRVYRWLLEQTADDRGNLVRYEYKAEDGAGVDLSAPAERHRRTWSQRYPKRIRYGNARPGEAADFRFEVVFDYGDHAGAAPAPDTTVPWPLRLDAFSTYRPGFEVRTYRLCRRILTFHRFGELGPDPVLVRSTDLDYRADPALTVLTTVTERGYQPRAGGGYSTASMPALEFGYSERILTAEPRPLVTTPAWLNASESRWADIDGEGISGIVTQADGAWYYRSNLGGGVLAPTRPVDTLPGGATPATLMDIDGDGREDVVRLAGSAPGFHRRTGDGWSDFQALDALPTLSATDPNSRFVDLTGDGLADLLVTADDGLRWYPSLGTNGYGEQRTVAAATTEEDGPRLVLADPEQSVYLADMTGDGLTDLVRIRNGEIFYWPNLGHGRFGPKVAMARPPHFDHPDRFDQRRIRLFDIDGSAPTDLVYLGPDGVQVWFNQSGNAWSAAQPLGALVAPDLTASVEVTDLLGRGTGCLVVAEASPDGEASIRYLDLMAVGKPHLLTTINNNLGLRTTIGYESSTSFYLADKAAGSPWLTRLPFPVHVVGSVETHDVVADTRLLTTYRYRHGYYDGVEREFRGFAYVEQRDAPAYSAGTPDPLIQPSALIKRWQHVGWYTGREAISRQFAGEYWSADALLPDTVLPAGLSTEEERQACRALRGQVLREEIFAEDNVPLVSDKPYQVTEHSYQVQLLEPARGGYAVLHASPGQTSTMHSERAAGDPRISSEVVLEVDAWGNVRRSASVAAARTPVGESEQKSTHIVYTEYEVINDVDDAGRWRIGLPTETREYEIGGVDPVYLADGIRDTVEIPYHHELSGSPERRLIGRTISTYQHDGAELPAGQAAVPALPFRTYRQAFASGQLESLYGARVDDRMLTEGGYCRRDESGDWWAPSGNQVFDAAHFYLPVGSVDPFGATWTTAYDEPNWLLPVRTVDPVGNVARTEIDYRVLQPWRLTDPNGNSVALRFDELGMVTATATMGKAGEGDTLNDPTIRLEYHLDVVPAYVHSFAREQHGAADSRWQESKVYSDGTGRTALTKVQAEPGADGVPRWAGTGRTVYDNKGNPVKKYEPYFSADDGYDPESSAGGVTPINWYDPLNRLIRTDHPDGTISRVRFTAWDQEEWDAGDTVLDSRWYVEHHGTRAAELSSAYSATPTRERLDSLGRSYLTVADDKPVGEFETRLELDIEGNTRAIVDARGVRMLEQRFDMLGHPAAVKSADAGESWTLADVNGQPFRVWDAGVLRRWTCDELRRPTHVYVDDQLQVRSFYGERAGDPAARNLRTRPYLVFDGAGVTRTASVDFKGNTLISERRLCQDARQEPDWQSLAAIADPEAAVAAAVELLEATTFRTTTAYDALDRPVLVTAPDESRIRPSYNEANLLERTEIAVRGGSWQLCIADVDHNARGQRTLVQLASGVRTEYEYDPETFRLTSLTSTGGSRLLQALTYTYDSVGNVIEIDDAAQQTLFFANTVVEPRRRYEYDALYRLVRADGREQIGQTTAPPGPDDPVRRPLPHVNDPQAMRRYQESYEYDPVGNFVAMAHQANGVGTWRRDYETFADSNRLRTTNTSETYSHDVSGNLTSMPHLTELTWNVNNRLTRVDLGGGGTAYYQYDTTGQRVRATIENAGTTDTRIYLGGTEIYRQTVTGRTRREEHTLHVMDGNHRVALAETATISNGQPVPSPRTVIRYQLADHLGTATVETNETGALLTYEEYHPYGTTSYHSSADASTKRYRFTGKEKDVRTGLYYHGARYYIPWLARWLSPDPAGLAAGPNAYAYVRANPVRLIDPTGGIDHEAQIWLSDQKQFTQLVRATPGGDGFPRYLRPAVQNLNYAFGPPGRRVDVGHLGKPLSMQQAGEISPAGLEERTANRAKGGGPEKTQAGAARASGQQVRKDRVQSNPPKNWKDTPKPGTETWVNEFGKNYKPPAAAPPAAAPAASTPPAPAAAAESPPTAQLELPDKPAKATSMGDVKVAEQAAAEAEVVGARAAANASKAEASAARSARAARSGARGAASLGVLLEIGGLALTAYFVYREVKKGDYKAAGWEAASVIPQIAVGRAAMAGAEGREEQVQQFKKTYSDQEARWMLKPKP